MPGSSSPLPVRHHAAGRSDRWLLLGAVLIGLLALQFLGGHDGAAHHRLVSAPPTAAQIQAQPQADRALVQAGSSSVDQSSGHRHAVIDGCCLLLLTAAAIALGRPGRRRTGGRRPPSWSIPVGGSRAPPSSKCRLALCVQRI